MASTRRKVLAGTGALATVIVASATALADFEHDKRSTSNDERLLELGRHFEAASKRLEAAFKANGVASDSFTEAEPSEAVFHRAGDNRLFSHFSGHKIGERHSYQYAKEDLCRTRDIALEGIRSRKGLNIQFLEDRVARIDEILMAITEWDNENERRRTACGLTAAWNEEEAASEQIRCIGFEIAALRATTMDGVMVKARAAALLISPDLDVVQLDENLAEELSFAKYPNSDLLSLSATMDLLRLLGLSAVSNGAPDGGADA